MRYTLEIQKLLLQTQNNNLHPREKANLLKEAIRIADENEDVEWATELRLDPWSLKFWMSTRTTRM